MRKMLRGGLVIGLLPPSIAAATLLATTNLLAPRGLHLRLQGWMMRRWCRALTWTFGLRVSVQGAPHAEPVLVACNHQSWLDIIALGAVLPGTFISKAEISSWPLIGFFARSGGRTLFINRGEMRSFQALGGELIGRLREGERVIFFPEGTVNDSPEPLRFKPRLFNAAVAAGCAVQPVALIYAGGDGARQARMNQSQRFVPHMLRFLATRRTEVLIQFGDPIPGGARDPRLLAREAWERITEALMEMSHEP